MTDKPTDDLLQRCRELLELNEKGESQQTALRALAATYDREIPAHDRRTMAVSQTHLEAMRALLAARPAESWQVEIDAYKREVRELVTMLCIFDDIEVVHLKTTLSPDQRVSMAAKLLGFANELLNGIDKS